MRGEKRKGCDSIDYTPKQIRRIAERYQELRSIAEVVSSRIEHLGAREFAKCRSFEHIICLLVDLDNAILILTPQQRKVVTLVKEGYSNQTISSKLQLSLSTIKFHFNTAILRMTTYLNSG